MHAILYERELTPRSRIPQLIHTSHINISNKGKPQACKCKTGEKMQFININTVSYDWCGALVSCILIYTNSN
jgi:hypothetical protein